jgi:hypothetical protein
MKILILILLFVSLQAKHLHKESHYRNIFCDEMGGVTEFVLDDNTRIDCIFGEYAVEVDFGNKFYEAIGQSLYYGYKTNSRAGIYLIIENENELKYLERVKIIGEMYDIKIWSNWNVK